MDFGCQKPYFKWWAALTQSCAQMRIQISVSKLLSAGARCHHTPSQGAVIFQGDHGTAAASSTTKRYGPAQRAPYFKHIVDTQAEILGTDSKAEAWLWKRYLKMAARSGGMDGYHHLRTAKGLTANRKRLLATYWAGWRILASLDRR